MEARQSHLIMIWSLSVLVLAAMVPLFTLLRR
jgi:hypothetical protein